MEVRNKKLLFQYSYPKNNSLLDYVAVMINELSHRQLVSNVKRVDFRTIMPALESCEKKAGWLSHEEINQLDRILPIAYSDTSLDEKGLLKDYRDIATHRYFVGIDELSVPFQRRELSPQNNKCTRQSRPIVMECEVDQNTPLEN